MKYGLKKHGKCCHQYDFLTKVLKTIGTHAINSVKNKFQVDDNEDILN